MSLVCLLCLSFAFLLCVSSVFLVFCVCVCVSGNRVQCTASPSNPKLTCNSVQCTASQPNPNTHAAQMPQMRCFYIFFEKIADMDDLLCFKQLVFNQIVVRQQNENKKE